MITPEEKYMIKIINDKAEKKQIARAILERLPEWFGIPEARENYIVALKSLRYSRIFGAKKTPVRFM